MIAPQLVRRFRPPDVMAAGLLVLAMGLFILTQVEGERALALLVTGSVVLALGLSPVVTLGTDLIVGSAPAERAGAASSLSETGAELGGALGIAVLGSIGTAVYRRMMADAVPASVPHEFAEAARGTLGGAIATAQQLPGAIGAELANAARDAFSEGLETTAGVSALIALTIAIVAAVVLRRSGSAGDAAVRTEVEESDGSTLIAMAREDA